MLQNIYAKEVAWSINNTTFEMTKATPLFNDKLLGRAQDIIEAVEEKSGLRCLTKALKN